MRFIPTSVHGILDYLMSAMPIAAPWLFGFARGGAEQWVPIALGGMAAVVSLFTWYKTVTVDVIEGLDGCPADHTAYEFQESATV